MNQVSEVELQQFLSISQQMLSLAENNNWDEIPELESNRKEIIQVFFEFRENNKLSNEVSDEIIEQTLNDALTINKKIEQVAQEEKFNIGQLLQNMKKKQNVHSAYLENK